MAVVVSKGTFLGKARRRWSMAAALVAALLFVLQATAGAFALGLDAGQARLDGFGNVICTHDGAAELPAGDPPSRQHLPACCVLGCAMGQPALDVPPQAGAVSVARSFRTVVYLPLRRGCPVAAPDWSPSNPRAPPAA